MICSEIVVNFEGSVRYRVSNDFLKVRVIEELVKVILRCSIFSKVFRLTMATNKPHFVAVVPDLRQLLLRRNFHHDILHLLRRKTILDLKNHQNSGQNY